MSVWFQKSLGQNCITIEIDYTPSGKGLIWQADHQSNKNLITVTPNGRIASQEKIQLLLRHYLLSHLPVTLSFGLYTGLGVSFKEPPLLLEQYCALCYHRPTGDSPLNVRITWILHFLMQALHVDPYQTLPSAISWSLCYLLSCPFKWFTCLQKLTAYYYFTLHENCSDSLLLGFPVACPLHCTVKENRVSAGSSRILFSSLLPSPLCEMA